VKHPARRPHRPPRSCGQMRKARRRRYDRGRCARAGKCFARVSFLN